MAIGGSLVQSYNIITLKGNKASEDHADICRQTCIDAGIEPADIVMFPAVDGLSVPDALVYPFPQEKFAEIMNGIRILNKRLTQTEIACFVSHYLLWRKCVIINQPIVILEHDARLLRPLHLFPFSCCILYLGNQEWDMHEDDLDQYIQPTVRTNRDYLFMDRSHAYAIDPFVAKKLIQKAMSVGIERAVDSFITFYDFCVLQPVPYIATVEVDRNTTIVHGQQYAPDP